LGHYPIWEVQVDSWFRATLFVAALMCAAPGVHALQHDADESAYFRAVARFFEIPEGEVAILGHWDLPPDEIPVVLFVARRAGVSAEALVALRESGRAWGALTRSYGIGANALHVPLRDAGAAGGLSDAYRRFADTPVAQWATIPLSDADIVALVNVRVLADALAVAPDDVALRTGTTRTFVELYAQLRR
jgi:hypothetical protein